MKKYHANSSFFGILSFVLFIASFLALENATAQKTLVADFEEEAFSGPEYPRENSQFYSTIEIRSSGMNFQAPEQITPGWTSFRYINQSPETHFFVLEKMPEGKTIVDTQKEVIPVFSKAMELITAGKPEEGFTEFSKLPAWFTEVEFTGGSGLTSPGNTSEITLNLEPGTYVMECYVKMPNGMFHSAMGMISEIRVSGINNAVPEPLASMKIEISNSGIFFDEDPEPGIHTFEVHFLEQKAHENFMGHDVHLVRLGENANLEELSSWMNWADPGAFMTPSPEGVEFLGGSQELAAGERSFFTAYLSPGNYVLVSEVPDPDKKNMLRSFQVPAAGLSKN